MKYYIVIIFVFLVLLSGTYVCSYSCCINCSVSNDDIKLNDQNLNIQIIKSINAQDFNDGINNGIKNDNVILIDIRTPQEYNEEHIEGAINIDYYASNFKDKINTLEKDKTYYIYCRSGRRTGDALGIFEVLGFNEVYDLSGGIISWKNQGLETYY
ncbi:MAG: rhodanese-like domain-containing protein [Nanoarchaeota archaeon]